MDTDITIYKLVFLSTLKFNDLKENSYRMRALLISWAEAKDG